MQRDIELFMPTLFPVVLDGEAKAPDIPALTDLDLATFDGFDREELTMAQRRLGESARSLSRKGKTVTDAKLAVLSAPYLGLHEGMLVYVQTSGAERTAYLAYGTKVDPAHGRVLLRRSVIGLARRKPHAQPMSASDNPGDDMLKLANMAAAKLPPGPIGIAGSVAMGLVNMFVGGGPTEAEIVIAAIQKAITAAVGELESFIVNEKIEDINVVIVGDAYAWLHDCALKVKRMTDAGDQVRYAADAIGEMQKHIDLLRPWLKRLTTIAIPGNPGRSLHARTKASKVLAHGVGAYINLLRLRMQFHAFLAMNETSAEKRAAAKTRTITDLIDFKIAVLGDDREFAVGNFGDPVEGSLVLAYQDMWNAIIRERADCMIVNPVSMRVLLSARLGALVDPYRDIDVTLNFNDWNHCMTSVGMPAVPYPARDAASEAAQKEGYVNAIVGAYMDAEALEDSYTAVSRYINLALDWSKEVATWKTIAVTTSSQAAR